MRRLSVCTTRNRLLATELEKSAKGFWLAPFKESDGLEVVVACKLPLLFLLSKLFESCSSGGIDDIDVAELGSEDGDADNNKSNEEEESNGLLKEPLENSLLDDVEMMPHWSRVKNASSPAAMPRPTRPQTDREDDIRAPFFFNNPLVIKIVQ